jgi:hypothetical protein
MVAKRADRGGFPFLGCIETLYLRVSLIILNENSERETPRISEKCVAEHNGLLSVIA